MEIQVLGSGCQNCKSFFELTQKAVKELKIDSEVEYIPDVSKIIELGIMSSPVLMIDGKPVMVGATRDIDRIKELLKEVIK